MNDLYKKNIETVKQLTPDLADWIESEDPIDWCTTIKNLKGTSNLLIKRGAKLELAYNQESPKKDIKKLVKTLNLDKGDATIVVGMGLGYLPHQLLIKAETEHRIIVVEPIASMYKYAFSQVDFSKYLLQGRLTLASPGKNEIAYILQILEQTTVIHNWQILLSEYTTKRPDEYTKIINYVIETINQSRSNIGTVMGAGKILADNDINNLPYVIRHRGIVELKDLYKGKPAVLICTGPSLDKNIHELIPIQDKVIIIAVAQALRILLAYNITPDFITTVDFGKTNLGHYKGLMNSTVPLVCLNRTYAKILKQYKGPKFIVATEVPGYEKTASGILLNKGTIIGGGSVAHLSLMLSHHLGCNPSIMLGQDLSLIDNKSHNRQADESGTIHLDKNTGAIVWDIQDHRSNLMNENKGVHSMGMPINIAGYLGDTVITNTGLASFILSFKNMIEVHFSEEQFVINSTEGGAKIEGAKQLTLHKTIKQYCQNIIDKSIIKPLLSLADDGDELIEKVIPLLEQDIDILNRIEIESKEGLQANARIRKHIKQPYKMKKDMKQNEIHSLEAQRLAIKIPLVSVAIYSANRQIHNKELKVKGKVNHLINNIKDLKIRLKRNKLILMAARKAAVELRKGYKESLNILKKYQKTKDESLLTMKEDYTPSIKDAFTFFKKGNFARPLLDARTIIQNNEGLKHFCEQDTKKSSIIYNASNNNPSFKPYDAYQIEKIATDLREKSIKKSIKYYDNIDNLLEYIDLMEENKKVGKEELKKMQKVDLLDDPTTAREVRKPDFTKACSILKKAVSLFPEKENSLWGYATTLTHTDQHEESIKFYNKLIDKLQKEIDKICYSERSKKFIKEYKQKEEANQVKLRIMMRMHDKKIKYESLTSKILRYKYELGQVMIISGKVQEGLQYIHKLMNQTDIFDVFLKRIGDLYFDIGKIGKAIEAYDLYLKKFPEDFVAWGKKGDCHRYIIETCAASEVPEENKKAEKAYDKLRRLKPDTIIEDFYILKKKEKK